MRYQIYSDESGNERYRSVGILSGPDIHIVNLRHTLYSALMENDAECIEFKKVDGDVKHEHLANHFILKGVEHCLLKGIRIDVLTWDMHDARHSVIGRDDNKNLLLMYYKVLRFVKQKWKNQNLSWDFYPDENSAINWEELLMYLENTNLSKGITGPLLGELKQYHYPRFNDYQQKDSNKEPLIQIIDLFTGLGRFSFEEGDNFLRWREKENYKDQLCLFDNAKSDILLSRGKLSKYKVLNNLAALCKKYKLGVSIKSKKHLHTFQKNNHLNYWQYESQGLFDKAPTRKIEKFKSGKFRDSLAKVI